MSKFFMMTALLILAGISTGCGLGNSGESDQAVLDSLREAGSDFSQIHPFDFYIYHPTRAGAGQICEQLRAKGFQISVREAATGSDWLCLASLSFAPSYDKLAEIRSMIEELTNQIGGEYDGWETIVIPK